MSKDQILGARRRTDWISLNEAESIDGALKARWLEQRMADGMMPQAVQRRSGHKYSVLTRSPR